MVTFVENALLEEKTRQVGDFSARELAHIPSS
jgi:hypothetical protein